MVKCEDCGAEVGPLEAVLCGVCGKTLCEDCYDEDCTGDKPQE